MRSYYGEPNRHLAQRTPIAKFAILVVGDVSEFGVVSEDFFVC